MIWRKARLMAKDRLSYFKRLRIPTTDNMSKCSCIRNKTKREIIFEQNMNYVL